MPSATSTSLVMSIWPRNSSGVADRPALYSGYFSRPERLAGHVEGRRDVAGLLVAQQVDQHRGEAVHRVGGQSALGLEVLGGQCVERPERQRIAVQQHQCRLWCGRAFSAVAVWLGSRPYSMHRPLTRSSRRALSIRTRAAGLIGPAERQARTSRPAQLRDERQRMQVGAATRHRTQARWRPRGRARPGRPAPAACWPRKRSAARRPPSRSAVELMTDARADGQARSASCRAGRQAGSSSVSPAGRSRHTAASIASSVTTSMSSPSGTSSGPTEAIADIEPPGPDVLDQVVGSVCAEGDLDVGMFCVKVGQQLRHVDVV